MRNLKKILALVLSLMMVLSVMVTASAADYSDADKIQYTEAVDVMSALGILAGANGEFNPQGTLYRDQAAKIITYVALGADAADLVKGTGSDQFVDVTGGWAYDYVSYCANEGIINGYTVDGKLHFGPAGTLTGYQFGKMLLNVLGIEGTYTGSGWEVNVATALKEKGLLAGLAKDFVLSANITREEASQLAFNAMFYCAKGTQTYYVVHDSSADKDYSFTTASEAYFFQQADSTNRTLTMTTKQEGSLADKNYGVKTITGVLTNCAANDATYAAVPAYGLAERVKVGTTTLNGTAGLDLVGHEVKAYYYTNAKKQNVVYTIVDKATMVYELTWFGLADYPVNTYLNAAGFKYNSLANCTKYTTNFGTFAAYNDELDDATTVIAISNSADKAVDYVIAVDREVDAITNVTSQKVNKQTVYTYSLAGGGSLKSTSVVTDEALAKGDVIYTTAIGTLTYVEKATVKTGVYTGTTTRPIYGTTYNIGEDSLYFANDDSFNGTVNKINWLDITTGAPAAALINGATYAYVLDDFGDIAAYYKVSGEAAATYAYVAAFGKVTEVDALGVATQKLGALVYLSDGTSDMVVLDVNSDTSAFKGYGYTAYNKVTGTGTNINAGKIYAVKVNLDGSYLLTTPTGTDLSTYGTKVVASSNKVGEVSSAPVYANDNTVTFFVKGGYNQNASGTEDLTAGTKNLHVTVKTGKAALVGYTLDADSKYAPDAAGNNIVTLGVVAEAYSGVAETDVYYYGGSYAKTQNADKTWTVTYAVYLNGEATTLTYNYPAAGGPTPVTVAGFYTKGATDIEAYTGNKIVSGIVAAKYGDELTIGSTVLSVNDSTKVVDLTYYGDFTSFDDCGVMTIVTNVLYAPNADGVNVASIIYIVMEKSNDAEIASFTAPEGKTVTFTVSGTGAERTLTLGGTDKADCVINGANGGLLAGILELPDGATAVVYSSYTNANTNTKNDAGALVDGDIIVVTAADGMTIIKYTVAGIS